MADWEDHEGDHVDYADAVYNIARNIDIRERIRVRREGSPYGTCQWFVKEGKRCGLSLLEGETGFCASHEQAEKAELEKSWPPTIE